MPATLSGHRPDAKIERAGAEPRPASNRSRIGYPPCARNGQSPPAPMVDSRVERCAKARGQRPPVTLGSNKESRKATPVADESPLRLCSHCSELLAKKCKSLKQISPESRRILTQRPDGVKRNALRLRLLLNHRGLPAAPPATSGFQDGQRLSPSSVTLINWCISTRRCAQRKQARCESVKGMLIF